MDALEQALGYAREQGFATRRVGIEAAFLPFDAGQALTRLLPGSELLDVWGLLEQLRLRKRPDKLALLRQASEGVAEAMADVFAACQPGMTKHDVTEMLRQREGAHGLTFEYCLIAAGSSHTRAPSHQVIQAGDVISLDSGGNKHGYIGDIARICVVGAPDDELVEPLALVESVQQAAFRAVRPGALEHDLCDHALLD